MKFIVSTSLLLKNLQAVQGVINSNAVLPILENFLFEIEDNKLKVSTTDLNTTMVTELEVDANGRGKIAVPYKIILETLRTLPEQPITFSFNEENFTIEINSDNGKYQLAGENAEDFPKIPEMELGNSMSFPASYLSNAISTTLFAVGTDEMRQAMTGVFFQLEPSNISFVATDAHKMVVYRQNNVVVANPGSFIVPKKAITLLKAVLPTDGSLLNLEYNKTNMFIGVNNVKMICRLIDAKFPDFNAVLPTDNPNQMRISRLEFLNSLKRISIFSNKTTTQVRVKLSGSELTMSAEDLDFNNQAIERLSCEYDGVDMEIGFSAKFLIEMLNTLQGEEVRLELSIPSRPGLLFPMQDKEDANITMLIMPVMLNSYE